jgi:hypothetical protein
MEPTLGSVYAFTTQEINNDSKYKDILNDTGYGVFVGTHRDYNLFAEYIPSHYSGVNNYDVFYINKKQDIEEMNLELNDELNNSYEGLIWFVESSEFPHPTAMAKRRTTSIRITDTDIEKAWRKHLQKMAIARGKHLSAKRIATWLSAAPPTTLKKKKFSGGPFYKRALANHTSRTRNNKKNNNKKQQ